MLSKQLPIGPNYDWGNYFVDIKSVSPERSARAMAWRAQVEAGDIIVPDGLGKYGAVLIVLLILAAAALALYIYMHPYSIR